MHGLRSAYSNLLITNMNHYTCQAPARMNVMNNSLHAALQSPTWMKGAGVRW